jgi:hypothetical protein
MKISVGFCGAAGAGKTTAANAFISFINTASNDQLHSLFPINIANGKVSIYTKIIPFASELKRIAREEFGWDGKKDEAGRKLLQILGTELGRKCCGENFWVGKWASAVDSFVGVKSSLQLTGRGAYVVLADDVRFNNEAEYIRNYLSGLIIHVSGRAMALSDDTQKHESERGLSPTLINAVLNNEEGTSIEELGLRVAEIVEKHVEKLSRSQIYGE